MRSTVRRSVLGSVLLGAVVLTTACGSSSGRTGARAASPQRDLITDMEIQRTNYSNLYDVVHALRGRWLQTRGPDTFMGQPGEVQVHLDDVRLGGVQTLRNISPVGVAYIQWFDPVTATQRWGLGYGQGAIYVSTRPR